MQQALLKIIEGTTVTLEKSVSGPGGIMAANGLATQYEVDTSGILFICGGAFIGLQDEVKKRKAKREIGFSAPAKEGKSAAAGNGICGATNADLERYGIIPELSGRLPNKVILDPLGKEELARILTEPEDAIIKQYQEILAEDGVEFSCKKEALERVEERALEEKAGARGLRSVIEGVMLETMFRAPGGKGHTSLVLTADDIDGITRPEDRLVWDKAEGQVEGTNIEGRDQKKMKGRRQGGLPAGSGRRRKTMVNFAQLHDDMLEYEMRLVRIMENLEDARRKMVTRRDAGVMAEAADLARELRDVAEEYGDWLQDSAGKDGNKDCRKKGRGMLRNMIPGFFCVGCLFADKQKSSTKECQKNNYPRIYRISDAAWDFLLHF